MCSGGVRGRFSLTLASPFAQRICLGRSHARPHGPPSRQCSRSRQLQRCERVRARAHARWAHGHARTTPTSLSRTCGLSSAPRPRQWPCTIA
eukprot:gene16531-biopygen15827